MVDTEPVDLVRFRCEVDPVAVRDAELTVGAGRDRPDLVDGDMEECIGAEMLGDTDSPLPAAIALLGWRAYSRGVVEHAKASSVGWMAFWSALSWPVCVFGAMLAGVQLASPAQLQDEGAGEMVAFASFLLGSGVATIVSWLLGRRIVRAIWPQPLPTRA